MQKIKYLLNSNHVHVFYIMELLLSWIWYTPEIKQLYQQSFTSQFRERAIQKECVKSVQFKTANPTPESVNTACLGFQRHARWVGLPL